MSDKEERTNTSEENTQQTAEEQSGSQETSEPAGPPPSIYDYIMFNLNMFTGHAWQTLGLMPNPHTKEVKVDLEEARVSIDCASFFVEKVAGHINEDDARELKRVVQDLKMNYVKKVNEAKEGGQGS